MKIINVQGEETILGKFYRTYCKMQHVRRAKRRNIKFTILTTSIFVLHFKFTTARFTRNFLSRKIICRTSLGISDSIRLGVLKQNWMFSHISLAAHLVLVFSKNVKSKIWIFENMKNLWLDTLKYIVIIFVRHKP